MGNKVKTSIVVDCELWEEFKSRVGSEKELKMLSRVVEEAIEDVVCERLMLKALEALMKPGKELPLMVSPVKLGVKIDTGKVLRELRSRELDDSVPRFRKRDS